MKTIPDAIDDIKKLIKKCLDVFYAVVERNSSKLNVWSWNKRWRNRDKGTGYGSYRSYLYGYWHYSSVFSYTFFMDGEYSMKKILNFIADFLFYIVFFTMCGLVLLCILILWVFDKILGKWKTSI